MTTIPSAPPLPTAAARPDARLQTEAVSTTAATAAPFAWGLARLMLGWTFLWPFLDKMFGLHHETPTANAWINGGSPTTGFLKGAEGPFAGIYHSMSGSTLADWGFMLGLLCIGLALLAGIGVRVAAVAGAVLLVLMWTASLPPANNPFMDEHLIYAVVLCGLALVNAGDTLGLGGRWAKTAIVRDHGWLR